MFCLFDLDFVNCRKGTILCRTYVTFISLYSRIIERIFLLIIVVVIVAMCSYVSKFMANISFLALFTQKIEIEKSLNNGYTLVNTKITDFQFYHDVQSYICFGPQQYMIILFANVVNRFRCCCL